MPSTPETVVVHPLVLLSIVDHYNRVARNTKNRVVGVLLGEPSGDRIEITNSYAGACGRGREIGFSAPCGSVFTHTAVVVAGWFVRFAGCV